MIIKIKILEYNFRKNKPMPKTVSCEVANSECKNYDCLIAGKWRHQSQSINGAQTSYYDSFYSCLHGNYHGCPDQPKLKLLNKE